MRSRALLLVLLIAAALGALVDSASTYGAEAPTTATADTGAAASSPVNWPQFRGPGGLPVSDNPRLPKTWSATENVEWVAEIPGMGWSSPIVWDGKVFLTTTVAPEMKQPSLGTDFSNEYIAEMEKQGVSEADIEKKIYERDMEMPDEITVSYRLLCVDLASGKTIWDREFHAGHPPVGRHRKNSFTSETPVTDGKAIYVYVAHLGLWAYDFSGNPLWHTALEPHKVYLDFGGGTSPALHDNRLFVVSDNEDASFIAAFDTATGKEVWRADRTALAAEGRRSGWATPFVWTNSLRTEVIGLGTGYAVSYDLDGKELWRMAIQSPVSIASPFAWHDTLYLSAGAGGMPVKPMAAIKPGASGEIAIPEAAPASAPVADGTNPGSAAPAPTAGSDKLLWYDKTAGGSYLPTPVLYDGTIYVLTEKGILAAHDATNGKQIYKSRIHAEARNFTASPWAYGDAVFMINEEGTTFVIDASRADAGGEMKLLGMNKLGDNDFVQATPAISGDRLLIRTQGKLYSIRQAPPARS